MMLNMVVTSYPLKSTVEAGKVFANSFANPMSHVNTLGIWVSYGGDGIATYSVVELEKGYEDEGIKSLGNKLAKYYDVEGYKINIIPVLKPEDALTTVGITPPS